MKPIELKRWMEEHKKTILYVADQTLVSTRTIDRFLSGGHKVRPAILEAFRRLVEAHKPKKS